MGKIFDALQKSTSANEEPRKGRPITEAGPNTKTLKPQHAGSHNKIRTAKAQTRSAGSDALDKPSVDIRAAPKNKQPTLRIPEINPKSSHLVTYHNTNSFISEQFRMLRTNILFPHSGTPPRTIMVTSALPDEGKSFIASNLALAISQNIDKHVLLLDCDMRKPNIHSIFGYGLTPGLSTYLATGLPLHQLILKTAANRLSILPAGPPPQNPSELLSSDRMADLLREVEARYADRFVLIDSPPPYLTAETTAIARLVDGIVLVVKLGSTNRNLVEELVEKMGKDKILGVVANHLSASSFSYYGKGKYAKYGKYGHYGGAN